MNQPKFKFGTFLVCDSSGPRRPLAITRHDGGDFQYLFCNSEDLVFEDELKLYEEPKAKKLYAFEYKGEIKFFKDEAKIMLADRTPEYDISYPENG